MDPNPEPHLRRCLYERLAAYENSMQPLSRDIQRALNEGIDDHDRRFLANEARRLSNIRMGTVVDDEVLSLVIFGCMVLRLSGLYPSRRRWLDRELQALELLQSQGPSGERNRFLDALKTSHRLWIMQLVNWVVFIRETLMV
ncbi:hypothetical protein FGRMN_11059, partial [Fusarium graminum]